jgi:sorbitol-specific phosphotransferase system component IIA
LPSDAELIVPKGTKVAYQATAGWDVFNKITEAADEIVFEVDGIFYKVGDKNNVYVINGERNYKGTINIPEKVTYNGKTYSVTDIGKEAFSNCRSLSSVTIPKSVTSIDRSAFNGCINLVSVNIPNSVTTIGSSAFHNCTSLTSVTIPNSVTSIGNYAFYDCSGLTTIVSEIEKPFGIYGVFYDIPSDAELIVPKGTKAAYLATEGWNKFAKITEAADANTIIENGIYYKLKSDGTLEVTGLDKSTTVADIPSSITVNGAKYRVTSIGARAFEGRSDITYLSLQYSIKSIGEYAFIDCGSNMTVNIANLEAWCKMELGNEHSSPLSSAGKVLLYDVETTSISIPETVTSIGKYTFYQCKSLTSLYISGSVTSIGSSAFEDCTGLTSVTLSEGLTSIGGSSFEGCKGLTSITIPSTVTSIALNAFKDCSSLNNITSEIQQPFAINENVFSTYDTATLKVPAGTKSTYQSTAGWYKFKNITDGQDVVLTANSYTREYGDPNPVFDYTREGDELIGTPSITCDATATSPVGKYTIRIAKGSVANSNVSYVDGTLTITKAPLSVTAKSYIREQGQENPNFEVTYSGFKNGEDESVLTIKPTVTTTATASSGPGTYDINVSGAEAQNYSISYNKGVLTVTEKDEVAFTIDGTTYQGIKSEKAVVVKFVDKDMVSVEIPASVNYDGTTYQVTGIDNDALKGSSLAALIWNVEGVLPNNTFNNASIGSNFLLYVKAASYAPSSVKNVVVDGSAQSVSLSDDGGQFYCPKSFTARSISYTHNYSMETGGNGKGWETIALPFDVQKISHSSRGEIVPFPAYSSSSNQKPFWLANFSGSGFRRTAAVLANEPYIIAMPNSTKYQNEYNLAGDVMFSAENVQVPKTPTFSGTFMPAFSTVKKASSVLALNVNNRYVKYSGSYEAGSCFISGLRDVRPFEAYLTGNFTRGIIEINYDESTTDMLDVLLSTDDDQKVTIHTLSGLQVVRTTQRDFDAVWQQLPKGFYIVNGKKWIK